MKPVLAALRTLLVLAACLVVIGLVAYLMGEIPPRDGAAIREARARREAAREAAARIPPDAGVVVAVAIDAGVDAAIELPTTARFRACDEPTDATLDRVRLDARGRELLAIGCGDALAILGIVGAEPVEVVRLSPASIDQAAPVRRFTIVADDVTGDGAIDWLVGTTRAVDATSPAVGSLHLVPSDTRGGLGEPILLAPLAVAAIDTGRVDADEITDFTVLHRPDPTRARAPEAWVFHGGGSPVRLARAPLGREATTLVLLDVDADGASDLVSSGREAAGQILLAGDGSGSFTRRIELAPPAAERLLRVALPAGGARVLFAGPTPSLLTPAASAPTLAPFDLAGPPLAADAHPVEGGLHLVWLAGGVVKLVDAATSPPQALATLTVPSEQGRIVDATLADLAGTQALDVALLVERPGTTRERDLVLALDVVSGDSVLTLAEPRPAIAHAPLHLAIPLR